MLKTLYYNLLPNSYFLEAFAQSPETAIQHIPPNLANDKNFMRHAIHVLGGSAFKYASYTLKQDKTFILDVLQKDITVLEHMSKELKIDKNFIKEVVKKTGGLGFAYASEGLKDGDDGFLLEMVKNTPRVLEFVSHKLKNDKDFIKEAIQKNAMAILFASPELQNNRDFILDISKTNKDFLKYLSDKETIIKVISYEPGLRLYSYIDKSFQQDKEVVLGMIITTDHGTDLEALYLKYDNFREFFKKKDHDIILATFRRNRGVMNRYFENIDKNDQKPLSNNREFMLKAMKLRIDKKVIISSNGVTESSKSLASVIFPRASKSLQQDKDFVLEAIKQDPAVLEVVKDKDIVREVVGQNGLLLQYVDDSLKKDSEIVLRAVEQNGLALQFADQSLQNDKSVVLAAIKQNVNASRYVADELKSVENYQTPTLYGFFDKADNKEKTKFSKVEGIGFKFKK